MRILITGATGFLGSAVRVAALARGHAVVASARTRSDAARDDAARDGGARHDGARDGGARDGAEWLLADLVEQGSAARLVHAARPAGVVHCAAIADIVPCRTVPPLAWRVNAEAAGELAGACAAAGVVLVHVSSDQVFDGSRGAWTEQDEPRPLHYYGETKVAGERAVAAAHPEAAIVRPGLITGLAPPGRRSSTTGLHASLARGHRPRMFTDELRSPIADVDLARALLELLERLAGAASAATRGTTGGALDATAGGAATGILHCGGPEPLSRHALALREADAAGLDASAITPTTRAAVGLDAERPADLSLDSSRLHALLGWTPRVLVPPA
jgi:dTDP-4-dehydrorhamnose reductase